MRVEAAEREAAEITEAARQAVAHIHEEARRIREEADAAKLVAAAEAEAYAEQVKRKAKADAREIIAEAHDAARQVMHEGETLSGHLNELSGSLRKNAERLLNDVKLAHARLTADLDQHTPAGPVSAGRASDEPARSAPRRGTAPAEAPDADFEIPEFLPRPRRP